jgi:uncharacterized membrane protein YgcG
MSGLLKQPFLIVWRIVTLGAGRREIRRIADRIARYADRFENAGRAELAELARRYADRARMCFTAAGARHVEEEFLVRIGAKPPRPTRASPVGADDSGRDRAQDGALLPVAWTSSASSSDVAPPADSSSFTGGGGEFGGAGASGSWEGGTSETGGSSGGGGESFTDKS